MSKLSIRNLSKRFNEFVALEDVSLEVEEGEFLIGFGDVVGDCSLSRSGDLDEAAVRLFDCLHRAAASGLPKVAVAQVPEEGIGRAINDRLRRAAA